MVSGEPRKGTGGQSLHRTVPKYRPGVDRQYFPVFYWADIGLAALVRPNLLPKIG